MNIIYCLILSDYIIEISIWIVMYAIENNVC